MRLFTKCRGSAFRFSLLMMVILLLRTSLAASIQEETFPLLKIGTVTYTNVTVTTKAKKYIFILHSSGMANIRVADLPPDLRETLGYEDMHKKDQAKAAAATAWVKNTLGTIKVPQVMALEEKFKGRSPEEIKAMIPANKSLILLVLGCLFILHLFFSYCCMLICKKTGNEPGVLVWLPLLQIFPILKAASMAPLWFLGFLVPGFNVLAQLILCFKLAKARDKGSLVGFLLFLPITGVLAFLYLAFSGGARRETPVRRHAVECMTLETA